MPVIIYVIIYKLRIIGNQDFHKQNITVTHVTNVTVMSAII